MAEPSSYKKVSTLGQGQKAEALAVSWLEQKGYQVLGRNVRFSFGELDIIARHGAILVFVEVRQRTNAAFGQPFETVNFRKQQRLIRAAKAYLLKWKGPIPACRFDVISILGRLDVAEISHIQNAFVLPDDRGL